MRRRDILLQIVIGVVSCLSLAGCSTMRPYESGEAGSLPRASGSAGRDEAAHAPIAHHDAPDTELEEEQPGLGLGDFAPSKLGTTVKRMTGRGPNRDVARQLYGEGEELYSQALAARERGGDEDFRRRFIEASERFAAAADRWPDSALEEDALFRAAESRFFADHYVKANHYFELLIKKYPNTRYLDLVGARKFLIAQYWVNLDGDPELRGWGINVTDKGRPWSDTFGHAVRVYDRMRLDDPTGKLADDATIAAANAHFVRGKYQKADQYYSDLRLQFPSSEHQFMAHYLGIQAKLLSYRGPDYTGETLEEAEKLIRQVRRQFPQQMKQHEDELNRAFREVRYRKAQREWRMAQFYQRRKEFGAARLYYDVLISEYADTPFADDARRELDKIVDLPLTPPQRFTWLVNLFPDNGQPKPLTTVSSGDTMQP